jgi:cytochrome c553
MKKTVFLLILWHSFGAIAAGDPQAGERKAVVCAACHGAIGVSINPLWPNLAGQHAGYLIKQLNDFKKGRIRNAPVMEPLVSGLSTQDMEDLAAFYAAEPLPKGVTSKQFLKRGELIYRGGDFDKKITACIACHGPQGTGNAQAGFPILSGQHVEYTMQQLQQFKEKKRRNDLNSIMQDISARMDTDDIKAVAHYVAGLH